MVDAGVRGRGSEDRRILAEILLHVLVDELLEVGAHRTEATDDHVLGLALVGRDVAVWIADLAIALVVGNLRFRLLERGGREALTEKRGGRKSGDRAVHVFQRGAGLLGLQGVDQWAGKQEGDANRDGQDHPAAEEILTPLDGLLRTRTDVFDGVVKSCRAFGSAGHGWAERLGHILKHLAILFRFPNEVF